METESKQTKKPDMQPCASCKGLIPKGEKQLCAFCVHPSHAYDAPIPKCPSCSKDLIPRPMDGTGNLDHLCMVCEDKKPSDLHNRCRKCGVPIGEGMYCELCVKPTPNSTRAYAKEDKCAVCGCDDSEGLHRDSKDPNWYCKSHVPLSRTGHQYFTQSIQNQAKNLINTERQADYGPPVQHWTEVARIWSILAHTPINAETAVLMMSALKLVRESYKHMDDNIVDAVGYMEILNLIIKDKENA